MSNQTITTFNNICPRLSRRGFLLLAGVSALVALVAAFCQNISSFAADTSNHTNQIKALRLVQSHEFLGTIVLVVAGNNVRMDSAGRQHFTLISNAPKWDVSVFRNDDKVIKTESYAVFTNSGLVSEIVLSLRPHFLLSTAPPYHFKYYGLDARRVVNKTDALEYLPAGGVITAPISEIVYASYRFPDGKGLCLHSQETSYGRDFITGMERQGTKEVCLTTSSAKWTWVPKDYFNVPHGYRPAKAMQEVVTSSKVRDQSADFQNLLDSDEKSKARGRH